MSPTFEVIEHTAEVGIVAYGRDPAELFANAARGMFSFLISPEQVEAREQRSVSVQADDQEGLLAAWLNELLLVLNGDGFLPADFRITEITPTHLVADLPGEPVDLERHHFRLDVKAATYHTLRIAHDGEWTARVIFDV